MEFSLKDALSPGDGNLRRRDGMSDSSQLKISNDTALLRLGTA
jgi:hypothetical protein